MDRRQRRHEDHQNHEAWAIPYADLLTLLLAFFVVMYAISSVNEGKYRVLSDALNAAFNGTQGNPVPLRVEDRGPVPTRQSAGDAPIPAGLPVPLKGLAKPDPASAREGAKDGKDSQAETEKARQLQEVAASVEQAMAGLIREGLVVVRRQEDVVEVELRTDILFPSGQARLTTAARGVITRLGEALKPFPNALRVEGHTDDRPISTAEFPSNWELSSARAASVVHLLTEKGVDPHRLTVIGHGEYDPVETNASELGRNRNRRVMIIIRGAADGAAGAPATPAGRD